MQNKLNISKVFNINVEQKYGERLIIISFYLTNTHLSVDKIVFLANFPVWVTAIIILTQSSVFFCKENKIKTFWFLASDISEIHASVEDFKPIN